MIFHFFDHLYVKNFLGRNVTSHYHNSEIACTVERPLTVTSPQWPPLYNGHFFFWRTVHTFTLVSTSPQWPLFSDPKVAVVERLNCNNRPLALRGYVTNASFKQ